MISPVYEESPEANQKKLVMDITAAMVPALVTALQQCFNTSVQQQQPAQPFDPAAPSENGLLENPP